MMSPLHSSHVGLFASLCTFQAYSCLRVFAPAWSTLPSDKHLTCLSTSFWSMLKYHHQRNHKEDLIKKVFPDYLSKTRLTLFSLSISLSYFICIHSACLQLNFFYFKTIFLSLEYIFQNNKNVICFFHYCTCTLMMKQCLAHSTN